MNLEKYFPRKALSKHHSDDGNSCDRDEILFKTRQQRNRRRRIIEESDDEEEEQQWHRQNPVEKKRLREKDKSNEKSYSKAGTPVSIGKSTVISNENFVVSTPSDHSDDDSILPPPSCLSRRFREDQPSSSNVFFELPIQPSSSEEEDDASDEVATTNRKKSANIVSTAQDEPNKTVESRDFFELPIQESSSSEEEDDASDSDESANMNRKNLERASPAQEQLKKPVEIVDLCESDDEEKRISTNQGVRTPQRSPSFNVASRSFLRSPASAVTTSFVPETAVEDDEIECWDDHHNFGTTTHIRLRNQSSGGSNNRARKRQRIRSARNPADACNVPTVSENADDVPFHQATKSIWYRASRAGTRSSRSTRNSRRNDIGGGSGVGVGSFKLSSHFSDDDSDFEPQPKAKKTKATKKKTTTKRAATTKKKAKKRSTGRQYYRKKSWGGRRKNGSSTSNSFSRNAWGPGYEHRSTVPRRDPDLQHVGGAQITF